MSTEPLLGVGSRIGSYRVDAVLGRGGMGVVYRAEDLRLGRMVALKLLRASLADDRRFRERFLRESRLAASIEHAAIVPIYDAGETDGLLYIAMRYVDGVDLAGLLRREGPLEPERAVALVGQLASALDAAHARGLIHRDVKPSNALIGTDGDGEHAYLVDFGLVQDTASQERLTATDQLVGTLDYLAPERIRGEPVDGRADVYALGCVLFECLTGQPPFSRPTEASAIYAHLEEQPPRVSDLRPGLPKALDDVLARALAKDRAERWQTGAELRAAARAAVAPSGAVSAGLPRRGIAAATVLIVLVIAGAGALLLGDGDRKRLAAIDGNAVGLIDPENGDLTGEFPVGTDPVALAAGAGAVWAASERDGTVSRIDRRRGQITRITRIPVPGDPAGLAFAAGSLWVTDRGGRTISQVDPSTNTVGQRVEVGNAPAAIAAGSDALWVASDADRRLFRVVPGRPGKPRRIDLATNGTAVATGEGAVWVASEESASVFRIEPGTGAVSDTIPVGSGPIALTVAAGAVWVANRADGTVSRIDPATDRVTEDIPVGDGPTAIAAGAGGVWVANSGDGSVVRIDPTTRRVADRIRSGASPHAIIVADGAVWTGAAPSPASHRGGTLRIEFAIPYVGTELEPRVYEANVHSLLALASEGLVAYRRTDSSTFGRLVGGLATDVPAPSQDGRTYVFKLRPGVRFSDGTLLRPEDVRASLEAFLSRSQDLPVFYRSIIGAQQCVDHPKRCDLSAGILTDARARTVTLRLTEPDPELLDRLAYPFALVSPAGKPFRPNGPVPGTGPYRIVSWNPKRGARLVRNRYFIPRSSVDRPAGLPDEIHVRIRRGIDAGVKAVERGESDVALVANPFGSPWSGARIGALVGRNPGRVYTSAGVETDYMFLNVRTPPFDDVRVRQALNYAVDRREIERRAKGSNLASLACELPPPGFPGYAPACRYTANTAAGGGWSGPDLDRARRLVAQSGTKGQRVQVWGHVEKRALLAYVASVLKRLGYRTSLRVYPSYSAYGPVASDSDNHAQIGIQGWVADVAVASDFATQFRCSSFLPGKSANQNLAEFCNQGVEAAAREATIARAPEADTAWQKLYRLIDDAAPYVALVHRRSVTLISKRVGNFQNHPLYGPLYEQMWVH